MIAYLTSSDLYSLSPFGIISSHVLQCLKMLNSVQVSESTGVDKNDTLILLTIDRKLENDLRSHLFVTCSWYNFIYSFWQ